MAEIRSNISRRNKYHISKYRYLELKNRCLQYTEWKEELALINSMKSPMIVPEHIKNSEIADPTATLAIRRFTLNLRIKQIEDAVEEAEPAIASYLILAVTEGRSFTNLSAMLDIPCGKDYYYDRYRKFFWILDKKVG